MNNIIGNMCNIDQSIGNVSNSSFNRNCNNLDEPNSLATSMITNLSEKAFERIIKNIKAENFPLVPEIELDDFTEIIETSFSNQNKFDQQGDNIFMPKDISIIEKTNNSNETFDNKDLNVSESNLQNFKDLDLCTNRKVKNIGLSSHLSTYQIPKIIANTSRQIQMTHNCSECCVWCTKAFAIFDNPNHIGRIRNIEKQNAFLKIEQSLKVDSCLCDRCFKFLEKTYKFNETEKRKGTCSNSTYVVDISPNINNKLTDMDNVPLTSNLSVKQVDTLDSRVRNVKKYVNKRNKHLKRNRNRKRKRPLDICSVHQCFQYSIHQIPADECIKIKQIFSIFDYCNIVLIESKKVKSGLFNLPSLTVCEDHLRMIDVIITCQLCCNKLDDNLNTEDWKMYDEWNSKLFSNNIPLILQPGMFICMSCQSYITEKKSLSSMALECLRLNAIKRYDLRLKLFGLSLYNSSETSETLNVDIPLIIAKMFKSDNFTKVKFADPLIMSTHYFRPDDNEYSFTNKRKKLNNLEVKFKKSVSDSFVNHNLLQTVEESRNSVTLDSQSLNLEKENSRIINRRSYEDISTDNLYRNHNSRPNNRILKLMGLLKKETNIDFDNVPTIKLEYNEDNSQESITDYTINSGLNDTYRNVTDIDHSAFGLNKNVTACMDADKDMLPTHVSSILDNENNVVTDKYNSITTSLYSNQNLREKVEKSRKTDENLPVITSVYSGQNACKIRHVKTNENMPVTIYLSESDSDEECMEIDQYTSETISSYSNQSLCTIIKDEEADEKMPMTTSIYSSQKTHEVDDLETDKNEQLNSVYLNDNSCVVEDVENDQNKLMITSVYSQQNASNTVNQDSNNVDLDEVIYLDDSDTSCTVSVKPLKIEADSVEIRKKLRNVVNQRILKVGVKKRKTNEISEVEDISLYKNENCINSSSRFMEDNIVKSCKNGNLNQDLNSINVLSTFSQYENENIYNSDSDSDITSDEDEEKTLMTEENNFTEIDIASNKPKTNEKEIHIESTYSLDPNVTSPFKLHQTLKKVNNIKQGNSSQDEVSSFDDSISDYKIMPDNEIISIDETISNGEIISDVQVISDDEIVNDGEMMNDNEIISDNENVSDYENISDSTNVSDDTQELDTSYYQFPQLTELTNNDDPTYEMNLELNDSLRRIYESLLHRFKDHSQVFKYLMENERMLYIKELVVTENSARYISNYLKNHIHFLYGVYGEPEYNDANVSYLHSSPARVKKFSRRSCPVETNDMVVSTSPTITTTTPVAFNKMSTFSPVTEKKTETITQAEVNLQSPTASIKYISVGQSKPSSYQPVFQPPFQLPTAVRSKGMHFVPNKPSTMSLWPNIPTQIVRNVLNNNSNHIFQ